jgi:hypothetical protein
MPDSWIQALNDYKYPVNLRDYARAQEFPGFFEMNIEGDRRNTIEFETHYTENAPLIIAAFFEVVFWKLYSQKGRRQLGTNRIVNYVQKNGTTPEQLWNAVLNFINIPNIPHLEEIRNLIGLATDVLAVPLTFPALANPELFPMIDKQVAKWVNTNCTFHSHNRVNQLTPFQMNFTSLRDNDFTNYLHWIAWCRECAQKLTELTQKRWRARDVEMAVFTAQRNGTILNVLP